MEEELPIRFGSGELVIDQVSRQIYVAGSRVDLTPKEFELSFLAQRAGRPYYGLNLVFENAGLTTPTPISKMSRLVVPASAGLSAAEAATTNFFERARFVVPASAGLSAAEAATTNFFGTVVQDRSSRFSGIKCG